MSFQQLSNPIVLRQLYIMDKEMTAPVHLIPVKRPARLLESMGEIDFNWKKKGDFRITEKPQLKTSRCAYQVFKYYWNAEKIEIIEEFKVLYLNHHKHVLAILPVSQGGINDTVADPRLIMAGARKLNAEFIVLAHNHPAGDLIPSVPDKAMTIKITNAARLFDITVWDHIIISSEGYFSFTDDTSHTTDEMNEEHGFSRETLNTVS
jgi:DNA repair protein RadC